MKDAVKAKNIKTFIEYWKEKGDEKQETGLFWIDLLSNIYDVPNATKYIEFEKRVQLKSQSYIDGYIKDTKVLIEQKGSNIDLDKKEKQSDGSELTPYEQAKRYSDDLPLNEKPKWIIVCNFHRFDIYDMNKRRGERKVATILLKDLVTDYSLMNFLVDDHIQRIKREEEVSFKAGELVGKIYDAFIKQYKFINEKDSSGNPTDRADTEQKSLNKLCVRIVFCLYAEDSGLFMKPNQFREYLESFNTSELKLAITKLFEVLNQKESERDPYEDVLNDFPYVNGGLFKDPIFIPQFTDEIRDVLINHACDFNWAEISPTIFGAVFESTLNPETRRNGGMHYTSIENIHKVIDPLFLDDLKEELADIKTLKQGNAIERRTQEYQNKLASLTFLDPAAGSGNFLTESYIALRRLENEAIEFRNKGQSTLGFEEQNNPIKVSISQFYGIEINDFAVTVAKTALWIAEHQMMKETEKIIVFKSDFLPLKSYAHIEEGNALRMDWNTVVPASELTYIMGNPPFIGYSNQDDEQKKDILNVYTDENGKPYKTAGKIDYVAAWYFKSALMMMENRDIKGALVSTNSITQGEQVYSIWTPLIDRFNLHIDFAYRTFRWDSEASIKAQVHCVIVGFSCGADSTNKVIFDKEDTINAHIISPYLIDLPIILVQSRNKPLCAVPEMVYGNKPTDGGGLYLTKDEKDQILLKEPYLSKFIKPIYGSEEYINGNVRYCLWLVKATPDDISSSKFLTDRVNKVRSFRLASRKEATRKTADTPMLFQEVRQPKENFILIPRVSSENRQYVPIGFLSPDEIVNDSVQMIPNAAIYHFGILTSSVHMDWMRVVCGRLKSDYRYSKDIVYNNFPWCNPTEEQKKKIEQTAQAILDARALYPDASLADMYGEYMYLYPELVKAHEANDKAVMQAYGFKSSMSESEIVAELLKMYQQLTESK